MPFKDHIQGTETTNKFFQVVYSVSSIEGIKREISK